MVLKGDETSNAMACEKCAVSGAGFAGSPPLATVAAPAKREEQTTTVDAGHLAIPTAKPLSIGHLLDVASRERRADEPTGPPVGNHW
jgi:hypothetical protein